MKFSLRTLRSGSLGAAPFLFLSVAAAAQPVDSGAPPPPVAQPVPVTILASSPDAAPGLIFLTPTSAAAGAVQGEEIVDDLGRPVWLSPLPPGQTAFDLRVQSYRGEPVLTWIQSAGIFSTGPTTDYIADRHYRIIAAVHAGNGLTADIHEFHLTREGTALITVYRTLAADLSAFGGPADGLVTEGVVQEIEVASGRVLFEWHSLDHVGLDESHAPVPASPTAAWDYFHINAVSVDEDGDLLVGARNTWAAYRIDRRTGAVLWRLGGTKTSFALGPDVAFAWQHNPTAVDHDGLIRIFDNEASPTIRPHSRVIWVRHHDRDKTAVLERSFEHPDGLSAGSQGNAQGLENGDTFVGWGALPRLSEFDPAGNLVFDAALPDGYNSYRAYRFEWIGEPDAPPVATAQQTADAHAPTIVHAVWNGATEVARWEVLDGEADDGGRVVASAPWNGLDTTIEVGRRLRSVVVVARSRFGREIGRSAATPAGP
ncbi:MAG TPA: arylsulfotransferase family protein [Polyangiaceae bacterium]|nr:arylsulfotransferase family protein [Polyangiaceae bacterium]